WSSVSACSSPSLIGSLAHPPSLIGPLTTDQRRSMSKVKTRHTHPPYWYTKKRRSQYNEELTPANEEFVKTMVEEKYGMAPTVPMGPSLPHPSPLKDEPLPRGQWSEYSRRTGVVTRKIGVIPAWTSTG
ncbi:unnamed protein product, partial [Cyprideis torosa]